MEILEYSPGLDGMPRASYLLSAFVNGLTGEECVCGWHRQLDTNAHTCYRFFVFSIRLSQERSSARFTAIITPQRMTYCDFEAALNRSLNQRQIKMNVHTRYMTTKYNLLKLNDSRSLEMNEKLTKILIEKQDNKPHGLGIYLFIYY